MRRLLRKCNAFKPAPRQADAPLATPLIRCAIRGLFEFGTWGQGRSPLLDQPCKEKSIGMAALRKTAVFCCW